jgi:hypothetical protein
MKRDALFSAAVLVFATLVACDQSRSVGSRWLRAEQLSAVNGGTIGVAPGSGEPLAGAQLQLDPGALAADAVITLEPGAGPLAAEPPAAGPVAVWGPRDLALALPARLALPYALGPQQSEADLIVVTIDPQGRVTKIPHSALGIDTAAGVVIFAADHLGQFQAAAVLRCDLPSDCPADQVCRNHECHPPDAPPPCNTEGCPCPPPPLLCAPGLDCHEGFCRVEDRDGGGHP